MKEASEAVEQVGARQVRSADGNDRACQPGSAHDDRRETSVSLQRIVSTVGSSPRLAPVRRVAELMNGSPRTKALQRVADAINRVSPPTLNPANRTGLPDALKLGIESLSGMSMDHVRVHFNSPRPAALQAHAYAQGHEVHMAPGQERHLAHEAWHVVQQAQGRVRPTVQLKDGRSVNEDRVLEQEADVMGALAAHGPTRSIRTHSTAPVAAGATAQLWSLTEIDKMKAELDTEKPFAGGGTALHHIVSRDSMKKLAGALEAANGSEASKKFRRALRDAAGDAVTAAANGSVIKMLENLPLNLSYGPEAPLADPGNEFDPATVLFHGRRQLNAVSKHLSVLAQLIKEYPTKDWTGEKGDGLWGYATKALSDAYMAHGNHQLARPNEEEWVGVMVGEQRRYFRKGLKNYVGAEAGMGLFPAAPGQIGKNLVKRGSRAPRDADAQDGSNAGEAEEMESKEPPEEKELEAPAGASSSKQSEPRKAKPLNTKKTRATKKAATQAAAAAAASAAYVKYEASLPKVYAYADPTDIEHFFKRHTYAYFSFANAEIKMINSFWDKGTTREDIFRYTDAALAYLVEYTKNLLTSTNDPDPLPEMFNLRECVLPNVPYPAYLMAKIEEVDGAHELQLVTLAPDGGAQSYSEDELNTISATRVLPNQQGGEQIAQQANEQVEGLAQQQIAAVDN